MTTRVSRVLLILTVALIIIASFYLLANREFLNSSFNGQRAYQDLVTQVSFGPRTPGSNAHNDEIAYIVSELEQAGWQVHIQELMWEGFPVKNVIAFRDSQAIAPEVLVGAHYDSRLRADQEIGPGAAQPVPGANDGASGVAILLELARTLPADTVPVWLVFFDAEDNGGLDGRDWIMGSRAFVANLRVLPQAVIIIDMVGDADLNIYIEANSDPMIVNEIWTEAAILGNKQFIMEEKFSMLDDHTSFLQAGIPAVVIIDFDYPYWHTTKDTPDKVSPKSLQAVGETLLAWITEK